MQGSAIKLRPTESSNRKKHFIQSKPKLVLYDKDKDTYVNKDTGAENAALYLLYLVIPGCIGYLAENSYNMLIINLLHIAMIF